MATLQTANELLPLIQTPKRFKIVEGGRGGSKSIGITDSLIFLMDTQMMPGQLPVKGGLNVVCGREFQNSIDESVYGTINTRINAMGLDKFKPLKTQINHVSEGKFTFKGLGRNPESIKSLEGKHILWGEEAQTFSYKTLEMLTPSVRSAPGEPDAEIWLSLNRRSSADPVEQRFIRPFLKELDKYGFYEDDLHLVIRINYDKNPWFPSYLEKERRHDYKRLSTVEYDHKWWGKPNDSVLNSIIKPEWFDAMIDAHKKLKLKPKGQIIAAHDPSDGGDDDKAIVIRHGNIILHADYKEDGDVNDGFDWAIDQALDFNVDRFVWDGVGLGAGLNRQASDAFSGKNIEYDMFIGSESVDRPKQKADSQDDSKTAKTNEQTFLNKRAQYYGLVRNLARNTYLAVEHDEYINPDDILSISSSIKCIDQMRSELCRIPFKENNRGLFQILTKEEMKRKPYELPSPNIADCVMMTGFNGISKRKKVRLNPKRYYD